MSYADSGFGQVEHHSLVEWLSGVGGERSTLVNASNEHGYYMAFFITATGDAAFYFHPKSYPNDADVEYSLAVTDTDGRDLMDFDSRQSLSISQTATIGVTGGQPVRGVLPQGMLYPLIRDLPSDIRVRFRSKPADSGDWKTIYEKQLNIQDAVSSSDNTPVSEEHAD